MTTFTINYLPKSIVLFALFCFGFSSVSATDFYWVGGAGDWSDLTHWATTSGGTTYHATVPQSMDDVYFDTNSGFTAGNNTVTIDQTIVFCRDMDWTGVTSMPVLTGLDSQELHIYGSLKLVSGMDFAFDGTVEFLSFSSSQTIELGGNTISNRVYFKGIGGEWTFLDTFRAGYNVYHNNGILRTNDQTVYIEGEFNSSGTELHLGDSDLYLSNASFYYENATNLNAGTSHLIFEHGGSCGCGDFFGSGPNLNLYDISFLNSSFFTSDGYISGCGVLNNLLFEGQGSIYDYSYGASSTYIHNLLFKKMGYIDSFGNLSFNNATFENNGTISGDNLFHNLTFSPGYIYTLNSGSTTTITDNLIASGTGCNAFTSIFSSNTGQQATITKDGANVNLDFLSLMDINASGSASFTANNSNDLGNNTNWTIMPPSSIDLYWVGGSGDWNDINHWAFSSGGTGGQCIPTAYDNVFFDANSGFGQSTSNTVNLDNALSYCKNMDWTGVQNNPDIVSSNSNNELFIYGSLTLDSNMSFSFAGKVHFQATSLGQTIFLAGNTIPYRVYLEGIGGEWTFLDTFRAGYNVYHNNGILRTNDQTVYIEGEFNSSGTELHLGDSDLYLSNASFYYENATNLNAGTSHLIFEHGGSCGCGDFFGSGPNLNLYDISFLNSSFFTSDGYISGCGVLNNLLFEGQGSVYDYSYGASSTYIHNLLFKKMGYIDSFGNLSFNNATFEDNGTISGDNLFHNLTFSPGYIYTLNSGSTTTITDNLIASGTGCNAFTSIFSSNTGQQATITKDGANVNLDFLSLMDINASGSASFTANNSNDLGNNTNWTIMPPSSIDLYWVGGSGDWNDINHWAFSSGGTGGQCIPTAYDNVFFDANSGFGQSTSNTVNLDNALSYCKNMDWTGVQNNPDIVSSNSNNELFIYGSLTLDSNMSFSFAGKVHFRATSLGQTIFLAGNTIPYRVYLEGIGGEWTFLDTFRAGSSFYHYNGILKTNNQTVYIEGEFNSSGTELHLGDSDLYLSNASFYYENATNLNAGTSHLIFEHGGSCGCGDFFGSGPNLNLYDISFLNSSFFTSDGYISGCGVLNNLLFEEQGSVYDYSYGASSTYIHNLLFKKMGYIDSFGNLSFNNATFENNGTISGDNSFYNLTFSAGYTYILNTGSTQTIAALGTFNANGNGSFPIEITSSQLGTQATLHKDGTPICLDYLFLTDVNATGTAFSYAGANSDDVFNNDGLIFAACPDCSTIQMTTPTLAAGSVVSGNSGVTITLILENQLPAQEAIWFNEDQTIELYASGNNNYQFPLTEATTLYGAFRDLTNGCISSLIPVNICFPPTAICKNLIVDMELDGSITIPASSIYNGNLDGCGIQSLSLDQSVFDCSDSGSNMVILTLTDVNSNSSTCTAEIYIEPSSCPSCTDGIQNGEETGLDCGGPTCPACPPCINSQYYWGIVPANVYQAGSVIGSNGLVLDGTNVRFMADEINLDSEFNVELGAEFLAEAVPCINSLTTSPSSLQQQASNIYLDDQALTVSYHLPEADFVNISISNLNQTFVKDVFSQQHQKGEHLFQIATTDLASGVYFLSLTSQKGTTVERIVIP